MKLSKKKLLHIHTPPQQIFWGECPWTWGILRRTDLCARPTLCTLYDIYLWCGIRATSLCSRIIRALKTISTIRQSTLLVPVRPRSAVLDCMCGNRSLQYILHRFRAFIVTLEAAWQFYLVTFVQSGTVIYLSTRYIFNVHMQIMINLLLLYRESKRLTEITPTVIAAYFTDDINCVILAI